MIGCPFAFLFLHSQPVARCQLCSKPLEGWAVAVDEINGHRGQVLSERHMCCFMLSASSLCGCSQVLLVSLVLSCLVLSLRSAYLFVYKGSGSTFTSARVLVWARVDGPGSQPTDIGDHSVCLPCSRAHLGHVTTAFVSLPEIGRSPLARTCSKTWVFLGRLHI